jgi:hypothetical protein
MRRLDPAGLSLHAQGLIGITVHRVDDAAPAQLSEVSRFPCRRRQGLERRRDPHDLLTSQTGRPPRLVDLRSDGETICTRDLAQVSLLDQGGSQVRDRGFVNAELARELFRSHLLLVEHYRFEDV